MFRNKITLPVESPVLIVDALGVGAKIRDANCDELERLNCNLDRQYHRFKSKIPFGLVIVTPWRVFGTAEFSTFRLNDMFVLYSRNPIPEPAYRYLIASSLLYHQLLLEGFIPRGGLGFGLVKAGRQSVLGSGFIDAYDASEKRSDSTKDVCAIQLSMELIARIPNSEKAFRLICFYEGAFFLHPFFLTDPDMDAFSAERILELLRAAGANAAKLEATARFLRDLEDYDSAKLSDSRSRLFIQSLKNVGPVRDVL